MMRRGQVFGAAAALMAAGVVVLVFRAGSRAPRAATLPADPAARAAYAAVPAADRAQLVPAWQALATPEGVTRHVRARDGNCPAGVGVPGAVILPCPFSQMRPERACWDFDLPCDLSSAEGVSFDFWCGDVTQFTGFSIYFKCGEGWRYTEFSPHREGQWHRVTIPKARVRSQEGAPGGWCARRSAAPQERGAHLREVLDPHA